jgi:hypothetical protein
LRGQADKEGIYAYACGKFSREKVSVIYVKKSSNIYQNKPKE